MNNKLKHINFGLDTMNEAINSGVKEGKRAALWKNLWYEKELTILFGETNTGKSLLAVQIAEQIAKEGRKVVYFDYEMINSQLADRYSNEELTVTYQFSNNFIHPNLEYDRECDYAERVEQLFLRMKEAARLGMKIFIVDNISCLHPNLSDGEQAAKFIQKFRTYMNKLDVSLLLLGHSPKKQGNGGITIDRLAGSKQIANFIDACFCMGAVSGQPDSVYIKQLKARTGKITLNENNVLVCNREKREDQFIVFIEIGYTEEKTLLRGGNDITPKKEKAYQLYNEGKSYREIAKIIGCSDKTAKKWIEDYQTFNQIQNIVSEGHIENDCSENENI